MAAVADSVSARLCSASAVAGCRRCEKWSTEMPAQVWLSYACVGLHTLARPLHEAQSKPSHHSPDMLVECRLCYHTLPTLGTRAKPVITEPTFDQRIWAVM